MEKARKIALWVLQILLTVLFANVGWIKLSSPGWPKTFREWGYPEHFYVVVGVVEMLGGLSLLIPRAAGYGAPAVMVIMLGAVGHHLWRREWTHVPGVILLLALLGVVAWARRPAFLRKNG